MKNFAIVGNYWTKHSCRLSRDPRDKKIIWKYYPNFLKALNMIDHTYNLVSHIYGPYPHHVLFGKKFPVAGQIPVLSNLQMLCDGKPVG